ncbi:MAG: hypothetical protein VX823_00895 [Actinomycetota bacterium]|nr:hypothetical protein [Acidimicrobiaceae bacterium]MCH2624666.1 hypothetical protein [Acidimicrobiales bacterium]MEC7873016.1 hypothetical protein [Actinomycetota bacterium]MCS5682323.1 hypothetical protein [Acidimicrobiales bacterium]MEC8829390.1 hypothetical protein [Actinomycetota bacterium]|tara:strand:+ start:1612 stop:1878 length:267 start_codon:yes stop_codon:yes gene_type:complete
MDLAVVIELLGDYDEWRKVFDEDLPARQEFSESMVAGPVDEGKVVILAYGVDIEKMAAFMGTDEFAARTSRFHGPPTIYQLNEMVPPA